MPRIDNTTFYKAALSRDTDTAQKVHWNSIKSQRIRFKVLRELLPEDISDLHIVDAGCGFADLYLYLREKVSPPAVYTGLEVMETMIESARDRTGCEIHACDVLYDPLPEADYYVCSGAMNILTRFETHLFIRRCFEASKKGFVFNLLKGRDHSLVYNYFHPGAIRRLGNSMGAEVTIKEGYLPRDFSVAFHKRLP